MKIVAGVDEVGRGSLIGPVYAAVVILDKKIDKKLLKDSLRVFLKMKESYYQNISKKTVSGQLEKHRLRK